MALSFENMLSSDEKARLREKVKALSKVNPWRQIGYIALDWLVIAGIVTAVTRHFSLGSYLCGVILIATRQHALGVMSHEAVHSRIFKNPKANALLANFLCTYPMLVQVEVYRHSHLLHHQFTNQQKDPDLKVQRDHPDWQFPMEGRKLAKIFALEFMGRGTYANWKRLQRYNSDPEFTEVLKPVLTEVQWARISYYAAIATALTLLGGWKLFALYWVIPLLWVLPAILRLRNMSEHYGLTWATDLQGTRDVVCSWVEGWLLAPHYIRLHLVHHLYPSVPFYNLPKLKRHLMTVPAYRDGCRENSTYLLPKKDAVWKDLISSAS